MESKIIETVKGIFSAKNLKRAGAVAVIGAMLAGGCAYWQYERKAAAHARVVEARAQMVRTQAEKEGLALLSENEVRTLVADAIGMDETAIAYRRIDLTENRAKRMKHDVDNHRGEPWDWDDDWDDAWDDDDWDDHWDHRAQKDRHDRRDRRGNPPTDARAKQRPPQGAPAPQQPMAAPAPNAAPDAQQPMAAPAPNAAPDAQRPMAAPASAHGTASAAPAPHRTLFQPVYRVKCFANNVKYELILDAQSGAVLYREIDD